MSSAKYSRVFIEYIHPSKRDLGAPKTWWDIASTGFGWRHARVIVTAKPVLSISSDVTGLVFDAGKTDKTNNFKLVPMYEDFKPDALNRYLPIGGLKANMANEDIKNVLGDFLKKYPEYDLVNNNCEFLAKTVSSEIIDCPYPRVEKMTRVYRVVKAPVGELPHILVPIEEDAGYEDAVIYDPKTSLTGKGPSNAIVLGEE